MESFNLQDYYMKHELCFNVDSNDNILGTLSKYNSHRIDPFTSLSPLHRAFSVFILSPDTSQLLLQQRSEHKITFPLLWANTCCSHPIAGLGEDTDDVITGIVKAAHRKLHHELGIPSEILKRKNFYHCGRIHYHANQEPWGEHEIDHILLMFSDEEIIKSLNVNPLEVKDIKFVNISELNSLNSFELTPWLQKILSADLLSSWISTVKTIEDADIDHTNLTTGIQITKYSRDPIIKL